MNKKSILIYRDEGVGPIFSRVLWHAMKKLGYDHSHEMRWIDRKVFVEEGWEPHAAVLIIPGGKDIYYHKHLQGEANARIKAYVNEGGSYLGICAGAYYGCSALEFDIGHPTEVKGDRELKFFPGLARGPAFGYGTFVYENESTGRIARMHFDDQKHSASYFNGGCYFVDAEKYDNIKVIARYTDIAEEPAAIIQCKVGKGTATLCGPHPEISAYNLVTKDPYFVKIKPELEAVEKSREELFKLLLNLSITPCLESGLGN